MSPLLLQLHFHKVLEKHVAAAVAVAVQSNGTQNPVEFFLSEAAAG